MTLSKDLVRQFGRFLIVGGISFCFDFGIFTALYRLGVPHLLASVVSFTLSVVVNYVLTRKYVFDSSKDVDVRKEFVYYLLLNFVALGLNTLILYISTDLLGTSAYFGKIAATAIVLVFNFITRKMLIERLKTTTAA